jgi:formate dehydrogenase iron-sulfur subunit
MTRAFVSRDMASVALGADEVAAALTAAGVEVVRTGSRGLFRIEPLVELELEEGRIGFGPVGPDDVAAILDGSHPNRLGAIEQLPFFAAQQRLTFARCGVIDPLDLDAYRAHGGWRGLEAARDLTPEAVVETVKQSGLRGRGGAGFPTGIKWDTVRLAPATPRFIVCNADEGDSGTFADRMLIEGDPYCLIEGMAIAAQATGASYGYVYIRSEYPFAVRTMEEAIRRSAALIAPFALEVRVGAGAYVCGEETALLDSIEGKRGRSSWPKAPTLMPRSALAARAGRCRSSWRAMSGTVDCSRPGSASRSASWSTTSAAAPRVDARSARSRSVARSAPISRQQCSICRSTMRRSPRPAD